MGRFPFSFFLTLHRTRTQIFISFLVVMGVVLLVSGRYLYRNVSRLILSNVEAQVGETANQISARLDAVLSEVDTLTLQLAMDPRVQEMLLKIYRHQAVSVDERLSLRPITENLMAFSWAIEGVEIYADRAPLYPLDLPRLHDRVDEDAIRLAEERGGPLVWRGQIRRNPDQLLAIRQVPLEEEKLRGGGYIVAWVRPSILDFIRTEFSSPKGMLVRVYDENGTVVAESDSAAEMAGDHAAGANGWERAAGDGEAYLRIDRRSSVTNWTISILVPKHTLTGGLELFRRALVWSLLVGTAVSLLLLGVVSGMITRPIRRLRRIMNASVSPLPIPNDETYFNFEINELNRACNKLVAKLHHLVDTVYEKERLRNIAEIRLLQAQINPHFLFNTLDSLYWNLVARGEEESAAMVSAFSKLFRYSIQSSGGDDGVTLADEIEHIRQYLTVMQYRLRNRLSWDCSADPDCLPLRLPKLLIQPIVENAISHGIEPKMGNGRVSVTVRKASGADGPLLVIGVKDNGTGMPPEKLQALRKRLDNPLPAAADARHRPVERAATHPAVLRPRLPAGNREHSRRGNDRHHEIAMGESGTMTERPYLMLVVEDEPAIRKGVLGTLKKWGEKQPDIWQFIAAASGPEGLEIARSRPVDFMICDIRLPGMSGIDMLEKLRREHCETPAILLTGYAEFEYARKALSLGVVNYLLKPVDQVQLIEAVEAALEKEKIGSRRSREADAAARRHETIRHALALIAERLKDPDFTLKELADRVHLHPNYLSTLFREVTGMTFSDYLTRQRLNMAKRLLLCTDKKIYAIAEETGFSTARYFIKVFRDFEGVTPKEFRAGRHPGASSGDEDRRGAKGGR